MLIEPRYGNNNYYYLAWVKSHCLAKDSPHFRHSSRDLELPGAWEHLKIYNTYIEQMSMIIIIYLSLKNALKSPILVT